MADYQLHSPDPEGPVLRTADSASIPADPGNRDWREYQAWLADGGVPDPYVPPEPAPPPAEDVVLFNHENRIRELEGRPPIDIGGFRKMMKGG
ncbi:hypothetical protein ABIG06_006258 [Bradyrhizobium sp. USDA 326]|uniref:hypothetical protein n=1 Tax=unclassified Bradyrhizobium TaxID=2631580 RepID=UPI0035128FAC